MSSEAAPASRKWFAFAAVGTTFLLVVASTAFSLLALPVIADDFDVTLSVVGWVVIVESLIIAALLLPLGRLSDVVGRHRTLRVGVAIFALGLVLTGFAPTFALLIIARIVTALGNTLVQAVGTGIIVAAFPSEERGLALGAQTTAVAVGAAAGPLLGGLLLDVVSWQAIFIGLAVPTAGALAIAFWALGPDTPQDPALSSRFDLAGALLASLFITVLVFSLNDPLGFGLLSPATLVAALIAAVLLFAFVRVELAHESPMLDLGLFRVPEFRQGAFIRLVSFTASTSILFLTPIYFLGVRELNARSAGALLSLFAVGLTVSSQVAGRLYDRLGPRIPVAAGLLIQVGVLLLLATIDLESSIFLLAVAIIGNGLGQGLWNVAANSMIIGAVPSASFGVGGAFINVNRTVGSVVGQAGATAIVAGVMSSRGFDIPLGDLLENPGADEAFIGGWSATYVVGAISTVAILAVALFTGLRSKDAVAVTPG